jgi:hypothetical protein
MSEPKNLTKEEEDAILQMNRPEDISKFLNQRELDAQAAPLTAEERAELARYRSAQPLTDAERDELARYRSASPR